MFQPTLKKFTILALVLALASNIYIFTYPSLSPCRCSFEQQTGLQGLNSNSTLAQRLWCQSQYYFSDVIKQVSSKCTEPTSKQGAVPDVKLLAIGDPQINGIWPTTSYLRRLEIFANDHFLGHIIKQMLRRLKPTHVAVMGDLFSSQWIGDSEYYNRTMRYTRRLLGRSGEQLHALRKESHDAAGEYICDWQQYGEEYKAVREGDLTKLTWHRENAWRWTPEDDYLLINITGNHDIGYSGDTTYQHMARYQHLFGEDNYWIEYERDTDHAWRIVVLNDLLLEGPALQPEFISTTWTFLEHLAARNFSGTTVLLTHVPFHKPAGLCHDAPETRYYPPGYEREPYKAGLLRSQNLLSQDVTDRVLSLIFANGKPGVILTGHDHEGCDTAYSRAPDGSWSAQPSSARTPDVRELTVRSVMAQYGGNVGLLRGSFDPATATWQWTYSLCPFAHQAVWYCAKLMPLVAALLLSTMLVW
ncbi:AaceriADL110Wp [[Ashbya] aceris (nom. inval.)]|nr:AaceriADL110Wp [[Ashbya] aceris (nom. inval.)]